MGFDALFVPHASETANHTTVLMDGGLGTTLEDTFHKNIHHPLWSARFIDEDEKTIVAAHVAFLNAGSQVILTSTYQAAYETFRRAGYTDGEAERLMRKAVRLAAIARDKYTQETASPGQPENVSRGPGPRIALSLGPFGATLETADEFTGTYPPPHGPSSSARVRGPVPASEEQSYEDALAAFHFSRLLVYAGNAATWDAIDLVAFETVPLVTEARAIRRAVARLQDWFRQTSNGTGPLREMKPWYISFVFPGPQGEFPQCRDKRESPAGSDRRVEAEMSLDDNLSPYTPREVALAVFSPDDGLHHRRMARPDGIGVNCTKVTYTQRVMDEFTEAVRDLLTTSPECVGDGLPWLVLSPNGGVAYDTVEHTWNHPGSGSDVQGVPSAGEWAQSVEDMLLARTRPHPPKWSGVFSGLLLGGCCKTGPNDVQALKAALSNGK